MTNDQAHLRITNKRRDRFRPLSYERLESREVFSVQVMELAAIQLRAREFDWSSLIGAETFVEPSIVTYADNSEGRVDFGTSSSSASESNGPEAPTVDGDSKGGRSEGGRSEGGRSEGGRSEGGRSEGDRSEGDRSEGDRGEGEGSGNEGIGIDSTREETTGQVAAEFGSLSAALFGDSSYTPFGRLIVSGRTLELFPSDTHKSSAQNTVFDGSRSSGTILDRSSESERQSTDGQANEQADKVSNADSSSQMMRLESIDESNETATRFKRRRSSRLSAPGHPSELDRANKPREAPQQVEQAESGLIQLLLWGSKSSSASTFAELATRPESEAAAHSDSSEQANPLGTIELQVGLSAENSAIRQVPPAQPGDAVPFRVEIGVHQEVEVASDESKSSQTVRYAL